MNPTWRKARADAPPGYFETEAAGLEWLRVPGGPRVVAVHAVGRGYLDLERLDPVGPTRAAAAEFGRDLARLHEHGAPAWGALPPGVTQAWFGPLSDPLPMPGASHPPWATWAEFYAQGRLAAICEQGRTRGVFTGADEQRFARLADRLDDLLGPAEADPPARLHGDLWSGNLMWTARGAMLIDPAAQGGHREADLAMLALFGAPFLDEIIAGYQQQWPLRAGWAQRVRLHQLYPLAAHAVLFGGGYLGQTRASLHQLGT